MISQSNIPFAVVSRLKNDETGEITFVCTRDGVPYEIANERYSVGFCRQGTLDEVTRIDNVDLIRPAGTTNQFVVDLPRTERNKLIDAQYTGYVYLVRPDGRRDPRAWFTYVLLIQPANFIPGQPIEPAYLQLDYNSQIAEYILLPIYQLTPDADPGDLATRLINGVLGSTATETNTAPGPLLPDPDLAVWLLNVTNRLTF